MTDKEKAKVMGVIMARGGSKSIPGKNIKLVGGKPLIAWTAEAAAAAQRLDRVIITTDSQEIGAVAKSYGVEMPFTRPAALAQDDTPGIDPVIHAAQWMVEHEGYIPDYVILLSPTTPLRSGEDIDAAIELALRMDADAVVSLSPVKHHPYWMKVVDDEGRMDDFIKLDEPVTRRQDLPPLYDINGAIYLVKRDVLLERRTWYTDKTYVYVMPEERSVDIDSPWDFYLADLILQDKNLPS